MPHPQAKVHTQMPLPCDVVDRQMHRGGPGGGMGTLGYDSCLISDWNSLPISVDEVENITDFKKELKSYLDMY